MLDNHWNTFVVLLRAGLWEQDLALTTMPDETEWSQIMQLARTQGVMGLMLRSTTLLSIS